MSLKSLATKPRSAKAAVPEHHDPAIAPHVDQWAAAKEAEATAKATQEAVRATIEPVALRTWLERSHGITDPESSLVLVGEERRALISFTSKWSAKGGIDKLPPDMRRERATLKIDSDDLPVNRVLPFFHAIMDLAHKHGLADAVSITVKDVPVPEFATMRHTRLSVADNLELERAGLGTVINMRVK